MPEMIKYRKRQRSFVWGTALLLFVLSGMFLCDTFTVIADPVSDDSGGSLELAESPNTADSLNAADSSFVQYDSATAFSRSGLGSAGLRIKTVFSDGRAARLDPLTRFGDEPYAPLDRLVWAISGNLSWDLETLRGKIQWDSLSISFAVGSRVLHAQASHTEERALTMERPIQLSPRGIFYPYPDFLHALTDVSQGRIEYEEDIRTLFLIPAESDWTPFIQEEIGHRYVLRRVLTVEPKVHPSWDGRGLFYLELEDVQTNPRLLSLPDAGEYARLLNITPTSRGTRLEFSLERAVVGWSISWDELESEWSITFTASSREVSRLRLMRLLWDAAPPELSPDAPIIIEMKLGHNPSHQATRYMEDLTESVMSLLKARLGVDVSRVRVNLRSNSVKNVESANSKGAALYISFALDRYNGRVPRGLTAVIPLPHSPVPLTMGTQSTDSTPGSTVQFAPATGAGLIPWDEAIDRHYQTCRYLARLMGAILSGDQRVRIEERPMADLVGLNMPVIRLYIGRQGPRWKKEELFPGSSDWESLDGLVLSIVQSVQEFYTANTPGQAF